jgi:MtaA/CmuA family methyltransferase
MNSYERYMGMVKGENVDFVPRIPILMHFAADYVGISYADFASDYKFMTDAKIKLAEHFEFDLVDIMSDPYREVAAFGGQIEYRFDTTPKCVKAPLESAKDLHQLCVPDMQTSDRLVNAIRAIETYREKVFNKYSITGWVEGPAAEAANLRGVENFLIDLIDDPHYSEELMDLCIETANQFALAQLAVGADTIGIGDAIASQVSIQIYENLIFPKEKELIDQIHRAGGLVRLHICGDINRLLPWIGQLGVDILDCDHMVNMKLARQSVGDRCVLAGNIDPVSGVLQSNPAKIHQFYRDLYKEVGNPFFINAGCEIPRGTPEENLFALCQPIPAHRTD